MEFYFAIGTFFIKKINGVVNDITEGVHSKTL